MRLERERNLVDNDLISWERDTRAIMSDLTILKKRDVLFKPDAIFGEARRHSYGWTVAGKVKPSADMDKVQEFYESKGYERQS